MSPDLVTALQGAAATVATLLGAWVVWRKAKSETSTAAAERIEEHMKAQDDRMERLELRLDASVVRERILSDYVSQLRQHIVAGNPPPPPPWPEGLITLPSR